MDYFNLKFHNTTLKNEIFAGVAMFMAMSYILVVCPAVLSQAGMDYNGVFLATVFVSGFTTILSAFYTRLPIALAPGLGITGMFLGLATGPAQVHYTVLMLATYTAGVLICAFVKFGAYDKIMQVMDERFRRMLVPGIGLALFLYGISTTGIIQKKNGLYVPGEFQLMPTIICLVSLIIIYVMKRLQVKAYVLVGLLVAYCLSILANYYAEYQVDAVSFGAYCARIFEFSYSFRDIRKVVFAFPDVIELLSDKQKVLSFLNAVFVFTVGHFFDAVGTNTSAFDAINSDIDERMKDIVSLKRAIAVDGIGNIVSGLAGTSTVTTFGESLVGIVSGGKTGITALTTGCLFLLCLFFAPLFTSMATYVAAPALIYVGFSLAMRFREIDRSNKAIFVFGMAIFVYVGITFNVGNAVLYGLIIYTLLKIFLEKKKAVSYWWIMFFFAAIHVFLNYVA